MLAVLDDRGRARVFASRYRPLSVVADPRSHPAKTPTEPLGSLTKPSAGWLVEGHHEHLAIAVVAIARAEDDEVAARVICRLADKIAELVQTAGLADQCEAIVLGLNFTSLPIGKEKHPSQ